MQEQLQFKPARQATAQAIRAEDWDLKAACTKYLEKHLLDFKLHILVQNMKAMCASEGLKWPMKINPVLLHYTSKKPKTLEGWILCSNPQPNFQWEKQFDVFGKQRSEEEWDTGTEKWSMVAKCKKAHIPQKERHQRKLFWLNPTEDQEKESCVALT